MALLFDVPDYKKIRVIIDTDAACEADDPFAIAQALMTPKFIVKGICAAQFGTPDTTKKSYDEILTVLDAMDMDVPVFMGEEGTLADVKGKELSPAAKFLIEEAMKEDEKPLYVITIGAITNIATAIQACPEITGKMTVLWIGGQGLDDIEEGFREFNCGNDVEAANVVIGSGVEFWLIPRNVFSTLQISLAEIQRRIYPCGKIGKHLFENMVAYNHSEIAGWTPGENWSLCDSSAVGIAMDPGCGTYEYIEAPIFTEETAYRFENGRPMIRIYTSVNSRFIIEDFIAKLELLYGNAK